MSKSRVEAFSDGVIAIIITILVLELKLPEHHHSLEAILELKYNFIAYAVSFIAIATIWISHHHLLNQNQNRRCSVMHVFCFEILLRY